MIGDPEYRSPLRPATTRMLVWMRFSSKLRAALSVPYRLKSLNGSSELVHLVSSEKSLPRPVRRHISRKCPTMAVLRMQPLLSIGSHIRTGRTSRAGLVARIVTRHMSFSAKRVRRVRFRAEEGNSEGSCLLLPLALDPVESKWCPPAGTRVCSGKEPVRGNLGFGFPGIQLVDTFLRSRAAERCVGTGDGVGKSISLWRIRARFGSCLKQFGDSGQEVFIGGWLN